MDREGIAAYLIPSTDAHHSEYLPDCWKRREWISGFTGSAGDVAITSIKGGLWTDGRYFLQAEQQLEGSGIDLFRMGMPDVPTLEEWSARELPKGDQFGMDPKLISVESAIKLRKVLSVHGVEITYISSNLVDEIWKDQPSPSKDPIKVIDVTYTGEDVAGKLARIRDEMMKKSCHAHILGALDTIAWTFNLRGKDIAFNPLFISYSIITDDKAHLFVDIEKVTTQMRDALGDLVTLHPYNDIVIYLKTLGSSGKQIWIDPATTNQWIILNLGEDARIHKQRSMITDFKSVKNDVEIAGFRKAHVQDGIAMVRFLKWLGEMVPSGTVTELTAAAQLEEFRRMGENLVGLSFTTISGFREHGAIIHYSATPDTDVSLEPDGIYLVDSGGQYLDGTTDITRTVTLGNPTSEQKEMFTRVLKGHIGLSLLKFPKGFCGRQIELPARKPLWDVGKNYNHGTGHGIGSHLNVHEGPMSISPRDVGIPLLAGNVLSNEPGYYKEGEFGIRIENLVVVIKDEELSSEEMEMLGFDTITLCPIDLDLVDHHLLDKDERTWLNDYHARVYDTLSPHLDEGHQKWLKERTRAI